MGLEENLAAIAGEFEVDGSILRRKRPREMLSDLDMNIRHYAEGTPSS